MKPFEQLTRQGKLRRLRQLALKALEQYDIKVKQVRFLTIETNTMFQVRAEDGARYVLRIYSDGETTLRENQAEMFWLDAINRDTELSVTEPVPRRDGIYIGILSVPGVPEDQRCVLIKWIPGGTLEMKRNLTPDNYHKLGRVMAQLHDHAETLNPLPGEIQPKVWNKVFYYPGEPVVYHTDGYRQFFPSDRIALMEDVIERADALFERLLSDDEGRILIHGDLHFWNVHVHRNALHVLDFEDVMLGYPIQDIAITLSYGRQREGYGALQEAFREGYASLRSWPANSDRDIETLMAARSVMFINYVAHSDPSPLEYIEERCKALQQLWTGMASRSK